METVTATTKVAPKKPKSIPMEIEVNHKCNVLSVILLFPQNLSMAVSFQPRILNNKL
jgi:hypothetical protein